LTIPRSLYDDAGTYSVIVTNSLGTATSQEAVVTVDPLGLILFDNSDVPPGLSDVIAVSTGDHTLALRRDGTVASLQDQIPAVFVNMKVPPALSNVTAIAAGMGYSMATRADGTVFAWGGNFSKVNGVPRALPGGGGYIAVAGGETRCFGLKQNGTVTEWTALPPRYYKPPVSTGQENVVAISAGLDFGLMLTSDGFVDGWGNPPAPNFDLYDIVAISAGYDHALALKRNGTVQAWGSNMAGATDVPPGLSNVVAIAAGNHGSLALKSDGTIIGWPGDGMSPPDLTNVVAISAGACIVDDGKPKLIWQPLANTIIAKTNFLLAKMIGSGPYTYQWQKDGTNIDGATNINLVFNNPTQSDSGFYTLVITGPNGSIQNKPVAFYFPDLGVYTGLFYETNGISCDGAGYLSIATTKTGAFSLALKHGGEGFSATGKFSKGKARILIPRAKQGKAPLQVDLDNFSMADGVVGTVRDNSFVAPLLADRAVFNKINLATNYAGRSTLVLPRHQAEAFSQNGNGYGVVNIVPVNGAISFVGGLGDATVVSQSAPISKKGHWPLFAQLYPGKYVATNTLNSAIVYTNSRYQGYLLGWVNFTNQAPVGTVSWLSRPNTNTAVPAGFTNEITLVGSPYTPPPVAPKVLNISTGLVTMVDGELADPLENQIKMAKNSAISVLGGNTNKLLLGISPANGVMSGKMPHPANPSKFISIRGVVLQNENIGAGYFLGTNQAGAVTLEAQ
jgi:hypothetical protein